jgi:hypothetical protein
MTSGARPPNWLNDLDPDFNQPRRSPGFADYPKWEILLLEILA